MTSLVRHITPIHRRFISIDDLPTEVLEPILAAICQDKSSRWKLPLLNRSFNAQFTPLLYRSVVLTNLDQLHRFVRYASDSTTSQARRTAVVEELVISLPPRPDLQAGVCGSCKQGIPERLPIAAGPLCAKQFQLLALGYSLGDVVAMAALGGQHGRQDHGLDSTFGLTDLTSGASTARITLVPERDEDRRFLVISEAIRICPMAESLHLDVGTWDWDFDMYYSEVERTDQRNSHGGHLRRTKPLPDGALSYAECEDHRLVAALGVLQQLKHFTWTHSRDQAQPPPYNQGYISKRKMSVLAYGFDAMARHRAVGHPLETFRLHSPQCSSWRNDVLPPYPTWRINLGRCLDPRYHSPAQRLEAPEVNSRRSESPGMHVWYVFCLNLSCTRRDESPTNKSLAQVVLGYGTHGQVNEANTLNFPYLRHVSVLEPVGLDLAEYGRLMCHSASDAKVRVTAGCLNKMELSSYRGRQEAENFYLPRLELALTFWLSEWFVRMFSLPLRDEPEDWRKEREEWRKKEEEQRCKKEEEERHNKTKRVKLDRNEKTEENNAPWRHSTNAIVRLVGSSAFRLPWNSWEEDAQDREALFVAAVIEKLCSGAGEGDIVATESRTTRDRSRPQLAHSKPLWRLLSRIHLSTRPLRYLNEEDSGALQHAVATTLIKSASEHARRDLQSAQLAEMPFAKFANAQETAQSLQVLEQVLRDMADVLARAAPLGWEAAERISREEDEAAMAKTKAQRKRLYKKARACLSTSWATPRSESAIALAHRLEDVGLPLSPSFVKRRLVHLGRVLNDKENFKPLHGWGTNVPCFWLDLDELNLWGIDVREALITGGESDKDIDWAPAALKEREGKEGTAAERSDGAVYGGAGTGLPEFVRIPIFGGRVPRFVRARYA